MAFGGLAYKVARVPKGNGKYRELYILSREDRKRLRSLLPRLEAILQLNDDCGANYAFERGKNCVLNAFQHIGHRFTLSMDLENFFDSVSGHHVADVIPDDIIEQCFIEGSPKQGLPTSPLIATIAFLPCDRDVLVKLKKLGIAATYTRYADDLVFSFDDKKSAGKIKFIVRQVVEKHGFRLNDRKTTLQDARNGRVIINGLAVDVNGIHPTRATRKKIRAAAHQNNATSLAGLQEWAKCKLPSTV